MATRVVLPTSPCGLDTTGEWDDLCEEQGVDGHSELVSVSSEEAGPGTALTLGVTTDAPVLHLLDYLLLGDDVVGCREVWIPRQLPAGPPTGPRLPAEIVAGRAGSDTEVRVLGLGVGESVLEVQRTVRDEVGRVLEHACLVLAASRVSLGSC